MKQTPVVGFHLLGAADLGVDHDGYADRLGAFLGGSLSERAEMLLQTRSEEHHSALSPIASFLAQADPVPSHLVLFATSQDPPHPGDTEELGRAICETLVENSGLYLGAEVSAELVVVHEFSVDSFRAASRRVAADLGRQTAGCVPVVNVSAGAVAPFVGIVLGCVEAGALPQLCVANSQQGLTEVVYDLGELVGQGSLDRRLVRRGQFAAMSELHPDQPLWPVLDARQKLDWSGVAKAFDEMPADELTETTRLLAPPKQCSARGRRWKYDDYRDAFESSMLRRLGRGSSSGLLMARPWIELVAKHLHDGLKRTSPAVARASSSGPGELDVGWLMRGGTRLQGIPRSTLRDFLADERVRTLWDSAKIEDHGRSTPDTVGEGSGSFSRGIEAVRGLIAESEGRCIELDVLEELGFPRWPMLPGPETLVFKCVGQRDVDSKLNTPMIDLLAESYSPQRTHLWLVHTADTASNMERSAQTATEAGFASVSGSLVDPGDLGRILGVLADDLGPVTHRLTKVGRVVVAIPQGTKVMNLAMMLAAMRWAFDSATPIELVEIRRHGDGSRLVHPKGRVIARLAHDQAVASVLPKALARFDLGLAGSTASLGSSEWDSIGHDIETLDELSRVYNVVNHPKENLRLLLRARLAFWSKLAEFDPWQAIARAAAVAESAFGTKEFREVRSAPVEVSGQRRVHTNRVWEWRNRSPFGHRIEQLAPPSARQIRGSITGMVGELVPDPTPPSLPFRQEPGFLSLTPDYANDEWMVDAVEELRRRSLWLGGGHGS